MGRDYTCMQNPHGGGRELGGGPKGGVEKKNQKRESKSHSIP